MDNLDFAQVLGFVSTTQSVLRQQVTLNVQLREIARQWAGAQSFYTKLTTLNTAIDAYRDDPEIKPEGVTDDDWAHAATWVTGSSLANKDPDQFINALSGILQMLAFMQNGLVDGNPPTPADYVGNFDLVV